MTAKTASCIDWPDLRRVALRHAWPMSIWAAIIWWFGAAPVVEFIMATLFVCAVACIPLAFVHIVTNGR